ncbi:hypothetical protein BDEG_22151 [Batrachochytrium dendrobatidis JEL423]|uniref:Protein kinase domain-containing protein n=1 Tax=Batrachochytrium dendrobatidis (strain JEL423) TaxID=403673 RepID=A0A177WDL3_BATDL|nr:hypothetical protein BDEG_22151 [Batrachochytrium dendrobatidis JEL423]
MENQPTLDIQSLKQECPGVDFDAPFQFNKEFTVGHYVLEFLPTTLEIIKNSPNIKNDTILKFVKADFKDFRLPITRTQFMRYLQCTEAFADDFMEAQSSHFAVTFKPKEHKILQKYETVPFKINPQSKTSTCNYGIVQQVQMEGQKFARKEQNITNDAVINSELEILLKAPENPHLISYHASYEQGAESDSVGELLLLFEKEGYEDFCALFRSLLEKMLDKKPDKRPTAFEVWEMTQDILAILKLEHHCDGVSGSPVDSEPSQKEVEGSSSDSDEEEDCFLYKPI